MVDEAGNVGLVLMVVRDSEETVSKCSLRFLPCRPPPICLAAKLILRNCLPIDGPARHSIS